MGHLDCKQILSGHHGRVWSARWDPKGGLLASCGEDKTIRLWGIEGGAAGKWVTKTTLTGGHERTIRDVAWSPCGKLLASASFDATTAIWDKKSGQFECNTTLEGHENEVKSVSWSHSGQLFATCSRDKSVWLWEVSDDDEYECAAVLNAHSQDVKKVVWHPHADLLASASYDNTVKLFREDPMEQDWCCVATLSGHQSTVWSIAFDRTGSRLATCSADQTVKIWQEYLPGNPEGIATPQSEAAWKCVCTLTGVHPRPIYDISWCHQTDLISTACGDDLIRIFKETPGSDKNAPDLNQVAVSQNGHSQDVNSVSWHPHISGLLASASDDGDVRLWNYVEDC